MFEIAFHRVTKFMGTQLVLDDVSFNVYSGERVGIVGSNGSGKTTVLKLIAGVLPLKRYPGSWSKGYDNGMIAVPKEAKLSYLDQIPDYPETMTVKEIVSSAFNPIIALEQKLRALEQAMSASGLSQGELESIMEQYHKVQLSYEAQGGYDMDEKLSKICSGLNLTELFLNKSFGALSGGERTRVQLAKILMDRPEILLLDEPTNHLDTHATEWLEQYLANYPGIVIVVSHDRYFLDRAINKIVELEDTHAQVFKGNYSEYLRQKEEQIAVQLAQFRQQQKQIKQMESAIKQLRDWAMRSDNNKFFQRAASMQIKIDKLAKVKKPVLEKQTMQVDMLVNQRSGKEVVKVEDLDMAFASQVLFKKANALVRYGERLAIIGPNGSGKSTLFQLLLSTIEPGSGTAKLGHGLKLAYLPQEVRFEDESQSALDCLRSHIIMTEGQARNYLAKYMFFGSRVFTSVDRLSGGEKIRLKLAIMLHDEVNLLLLDEPTNHLDIESIETLEAALEEYQGTLMFISHDRYFINKLAERILCIEAFNLKSYDGDYDYYKAQIAKVKDSERVPSQRENQSPVSEKTKESTKDSKDSRDSVAGKEAAGKGSGKPIRLKVVKSRDYESEIGEVEAQITKIEVEMHASGSDYVRLVQLEEDRSTLVVRLNELWREWESSSEEN